MSRTPETITNRFTQFLRWVLVGTGILFALAALGGFQNGGAVFVPTLISGGAFFVAAKLKVHWQKKAEAGLYK